MSGDSEWVELTLEQITAPGARIEVADALKLARLCSTLAVKLEEDGGADLMAALLCTCTDIILRQHLMLRQANLLPRAELQRCGSTH